MATPTTPPAVGYRWELQRNVQVFTGPAGGHGGLPLPPFYGEDGTYHANFDGVGGPFIVGGNYAFPGAIDYQLERWIFAQFQMWVDGLATELVAVEPHKDAGSQCVNVLNAFTYPTNPGTLWGITFQYTTISHSHAGDSGSLGAQLLQVVGDVWTMVPITSNIDNLNPESPLNGDGGPRMPPTLIEGAPIGLQLAWPRHNQRIDWARHELGAVVGLTWNRWNPLWDGEKRFMLDGLKVVVEIESHGGWHGQVDYQFTRIPDTGLDGEIGGPGAPFTLDVTALDDPDHPLG